MILKVTQYVSLSSSIYYHIRLHPRQIDHNSMHYYWNNNVADIEDGVVVVVDSGKVYINSVYKKRTTAATTTVTSIYDASVILSTCNDRNMSDDNGTK